MVDPAIARDALLVPFDDGARVGVSLFLPARARSTVLCLPALGVVASYYEPLALALAGRGVAAVTADLRGLGQSSVRPRRGIDFGYARLVDDAAEVVTHVRRRLPGPLFVLGHSLGGHVGALLAGSRPAAIDGLVLAACGTPYWKCFPLRTGLQVKGLAHAAGVLGTLLGYFPGHRVGFGGAEAAQLMKEWGTLARRGRLVAAGFDAERAFAEARVATLAISLEFDWMAPPAAVDHLVNKLGAEVERVHLTAASADLRALDHFRWVRFPESVAEVAARWIDRRSAQRA